MAPAHSMKVPMPLAVPFPELTRVPIFGIDQNTEQLQFEWPQRGNVDPSMIPDVRVTQLKFICNYDMRGVQIKLSNGMLSPIFQQSWPNALDHHDENRTNRIETTEVAEGAIVKASAAAWQVDSSFMKKLTLTGERGVQLAHV